MGSPPDCRPSARLRSGRRASGKPQPFDVKPCHVLEQIQKTAHFALCAAGILPQLRDRVARLAVARVVHGVCGLLHAVFKLPQLRGRLRHFGAHVVDARAQLRGLAAVSPVCALHLHQLLAHQAQRFLLVFQALW